MEEIASLYEQWLETQDEAIQDIIEKHPNFEKFSQQIHHEILDNMSHNVVFDVFNSFQKHYIIEYSAEGPYINKKHDFYSKLTLSIMESAIRIFLEETDIFNIDFSFIYEEFKENKSKRWTRNCLNDTNPRCVLKEIVQKLIASGKV